MGWLNGTKLKVRGLTWTKMKLHDWIEFWTKFESVICNLVPKKGVKCMMNMHWNSTMSTQNLGPQTFVPQFYHKSNMIDYVSGGKKKVINLYTKMTDIGKHNLFIFFW